MIKIIELPQVGESVTEGVIGKWLVEPGQHVEKYDPLVEVVTDKVSMEAPSPYTGVFVRALADEGETVPMGQPICEMDVEGEEPSAAAPTDEPAEDSEDAPVEAEAAEEDAGRVGGAWAMPAARGGDVGESAQSEEAAQPAFEFMDSVRSVGPTGSGEHGEGRLDALQEEAHAGAEHESAAPSVAEPDRRYVISPLVARLSAQYGIDLSTLQGTGIGGRITSKDLLEAVNRLTAGAQAESTEEETAAPDPLSLQGERARVRVPWGEVEETAPEEEAASEQEAADVAPEEAPEEPAAAMAEEEPLAEEAAEEQEEEEAVALAVEETAPEEVAASEQEAADVAPEEAPEEPAAAMAEEEPLAEEAAEEQEEEEAVALAVEEAVEEAAGEGEPEAAAAEEEAAAPDPLSLQGERARVRVPWGGVEETAPEAVEEETTAVEEVEEEPAEAAPEAAAAEETSVMPLTPVRRIIAEHMARSSREIPAAWAMVETDVTRLVRAREALRAAFEEKHGIPLTYLPFAASAVAAALREHPRLNARWDDGHITLNNRVNLAVAVATEAGLMVPVVRDADALSIAGIAAELRRLTDGARAGTLSIEDVQGGTFTLNNTGALGSVVSVPIINHPQAAILTTEAIVKRPVVVEGDAIAVRSMMNLCLTFDHRVCDGAEAAAFLSAVKARLEVIDESIGLG